MSYSFEFEGAVLGPGVQRMTMWPPGDSKNNNVIKLTGVSLTCKLDTELTASRLLAGRSV